MLTAKSSDELILVLKCFILITRSNSSSITITTNTVTSLLKEGEDENENQNESIRKEESELIIPRDVVSILMSVIGHRIKLKELEDEIELFWGGNNVNDLKENEATRKGGGVEDIIRSIVGMV